MSDYNCFKCHQMFHTSELHETDIEGLELLCWNCIKSLQEKEGTSK